LPLKKDHFLLPSGRLAGTELGAVTTGREYKGVGELKRLSALVSGKTVFVAEYEHDQSGRIVKMTETIDQKTATYHYDYDDSDRLMDVTRDGVKIGHYEYDSNGNLLAYDGLKGARRGRYDGQDRLLEYGDTTWTHTASGYWQSRTTGRQRTHYEYDALGNLRVVVLPDGTKIEYLIDALNRRIGKKVNGKLVQGFLYEDQIRVAAELDGENRVVSRFVFGSRVNVPEYIDKGQKRYRIITDHLGSPCLVIEVESGEVVQRIDYDPFGSVLRDTNPGFQPFGFAGGLYDGRTRLVRFGARDYDAETGRWTTKDPAGFGGGSTNLYAYVGNNPTTLVDPQGMKGGPTLQGEVKCPDFSPRSIPPQCENPWLRRCYEGPQDNLTVYIEDPATGGHKACTYQSIVCECYDKYPDLEDPFRWWNPFTWFWRKPEIIGMYRGWSQTSDTD
jgi:RHS repeat-associated protein